MLALVLKGNGFYPECVVVFNSMRHRTGRGFDWLTILMARSSPVKIPVTFVFAGHRSMHLGWLRVGCDDHRTRRVHFKTQHCKSSAPTGIVMLKTEHWLVSHSLFSRTDCFSCSLHSLVACSSLGRVMSSGDFPCPLWDVYWCHPCSAHVGELYKCSF